MDLDLRLERMGVVDNLTPPLMDHARACLASFFKSRKK